MTDKAALEYGDVTIELKEAVDTWKAPLEKVFPNCFGTDGGESCERTTVQHRQHPYLQP